MLLGIGLGLPWAVSGVAIIKRPRVGAWLGLAVASLSFVGAGWIISQANVAQGRWVAELLFASSDWEVCASGSRYASCGRPPQPNGMPAYSAISSSATG